MPNWTENKLTVDNVTPEFTEFIKAGFSFERMAKPNRPESDEAGFVTVAAQTAAWGTKWDLDEETQQRVAGELLEYDTVSFDTAWSPPINAIEALSAMFPEVGFTLAYNEPGMCFYGRADFIDGACSDECYDSSDKEHYINFLVDELGYDEDAVREEFEDEEE
jgi:hypothetical protein